MTTRVLVVDDSPTIRKVVSGVLQRHGFDTVLAADGQTAFDTLAEAAQSANGNGGSKIRCGAPRLHDAQDERLATLSPAAPERAAPRDTRRPDERPVGPNCRARRSPDRRHRRNRQTVRRSGPHCRHRKRDAAVSQMASARDRGRGRDHGGEAAPRAPALDGAPGSAVGGPRHHPDRSGAAATSGGGQDRGDGGQRWEDRSNDLPARWAHRPRSGARSRAGIPSRSLLHRARSRDRRGHRIGSSESPSPLIPTRGESRGGCSGTYSSMRDG